jgi:hypothetical protein
MRRVTAIAALLAGCAASEPCDPWAGGYRFTVVSHDTACHPHLAFDVEIGDSDGGRPERDQDGCWYAVELDRCDALHLLRFCPPGNQVVIDWTLERHGDSAHGEVEHASAECSVALTVSVAPAH